MIRTQPPEKILFYLALAVFVGGGLLRAWFVDFSDFDYGVYSDHFINAVTAKNIAIGLHWSSSGYETYLLNPENLTVGPTVVLPVVAAILAFGNTLAVPTLTLLLLNLFLFFLLLRSLRQIYRDDQSFYLCAFLLVLFFALFKSYYWYRMTGETPAILLLVLTTSYLYRYFDQFNTRLLLMAGIAATFAMGTKELVTLPLAVLVFTFFFISYWRDKKIAGCARKTILFLSLCCVIPVLFFIYQQALLNSQPETWRSGYSAYAAAIHNYYSGISVLHKYLDSPANFIKIARQVSRHTLWNGGTLLHLSILGMRGLQLWLLIFSAFLGYLCVRRKFTTLPMLLAISALPLLLWFFFISEKAMPRHLYIALCLAIISLLLYITTVKNRTLRNALAFTIIFILVITGDRSSRLLLSVWPTTASPLAAAILDMQQRIAQNAPKTFAWIGMIDNNEFEYLANSSNNFVNGFDLLVDGVTFDEEAYRLSHPQIESLIKNGRYRSGFDFYLSPENTRRETVKVNVVRPINFNWLHFKKEIAQFQHSGFNLTRGDLCKDILYQNEYYVVERCSADDIRESLAKVGGLPLRPRKWTPTILLPSERAELF